MAVAIDDGGAALALALSPDESKVFVGGSFSRSIALGTVSLTSGSSNGDGYNIISR